MTRLLLIRHGRTAWNKEERFRGRENLPLDEVGHAQAKALARRLAAEFPTLTALYASPLRRARETATPIATTLGLVVEPHPGLIDINYGDWQGLTPAEVAARYPVLYQTWVVAPAQVRFPGGETLSEVRLRARAAMDGIASHRPNETVAIVSHLVVCRLLLCSVLEMPMSQSTLLRQATGCFNVLETVGTRIEIITMNDVCHLRGLDS
ncbi:MAG: histidine phosphatase family protein [Anaerolineae bacterium]|nr:histidine phosphatase family protein [Anaerolineae bacterium]